MLTLVGNKMDLVDDEDGRPVTTKDGVRLAEVNHFFTFSKRFMQALLQVLITGHKLYLFITFFVRYPLCF